MFSYSTSTVFDSLLNPREIFWKDLFSGTPSFDTLFEDNKFHVPANIWYDDKELVIELAITGIEDPYKDISIRSEADIIHFEYPADEAKKAEKKKVDRPERTYIQRKLSTKDFNFSLRINKCWDIEKINAKVRNGMLIVTIPKLVIDKIKPVQVTIE